jgi:aryl-alcohol dehydrogenase
MSYASCGGCQRCLHGHASSCTSWMVMNMMGARQDGSTALSRNGELIHSHFFGQSSFATRAVVLESSLVPMPDDVPDEIAAVLGCGVQTGAGAVINVLQPPAGSSIAVFGAGTVGLSAVMAAAIVGCSRIIAIDLHSSRLELAQELGATDVIEASEGLDVAAKIFELTGGAGAGFAIETTGAPSVLPVAVYCTGIGGKIGLIGAAPAGTELGVDVAAIMALCKTIVGIMEGDAVPRTFIPQLIEHWRGGRLPLERLVQTFPFAQINDAVAASLSGDVIKPVLTMA